MARLGWLGRRPAHNPLGDGVWRRAHDRFRRAVDRYHQMIEPVPDGAVRDRLERAGADLAALLDVVHDRCVEAQRSTPSASLEVPGAAAGTHRAVSRAGTLAAQAAQSAAMARVALRGGRADEAAAHAEAAGRAVGQAGAQLA